MTITTTKTCTKCGIKKETLEFSKHMKSKDKLNSWCKECCKNNSKQYRTINSKKYETIIKNRWNSINQRCVNGVYSKSTSVQHSPQFQSYHKKNITINMTKEEFTTWMLSVEDLHNEIISVGEKSSIDRIDDSKGYEIGNIQMISQKDNIEKRFGKTITTKSPEARKKACERKKLEYQKSKEGIV